MKYAIIGCGAVGGYYGGSLQHAGAECHFLLHGDFDHVRAHGLKVDTKTGGFHLQRVNAYARAADMPRCDVALVALKATQNRLLPEILPHVLSADGLVLLLQNGLGSEEGIEKIPGVRKIVRGLCFLCSNKAGPGHIRHLDYGMITLGRWTADGKPAGITPEVEAIARDFEPTGIPVRPAGDIVGATWKKLVWNIPFNGLCAVLRADTGRLMADSATRGLAEAIMGEVTAAAAACGHPLPGAVGEMMALTEKMTPYHPSMLLDIASGREIELDAIYNEPMRRGAARGVQMPLTGMLRSQLGFIATC